MSARFFHSIVVCLCLSKLSAIFLIMARFLAVVTGEWLLLRVGIALHHENTFGLVSLIFLFQLLLSLSNRSVTLSRGGKVSQVLSPTHHSFREGLQTGT